MSAFNWRSYEGLTVGVAVLAVAAMALSAAALAQGPERVVVTQQPGGEKIISVQGEGVLDVSPDTAVIDLGLRVQRPSAREAQAAVAKDLAAVVEALKGIGVAEKDMRTSRAALEPVYDYSAKGPPRLVGYSASQFLTITTRELDRVGPIVDHAIASGANEVRGIQFTLKDEAQAKQQALDMALEDARRQAEQIARKTGAELDKVRTVSLLPGTGGPEPPYPIRAAKLAAEAAGPPDWSTPVLAGTMRFQVNVNVEYLLK